jgi:septum site-determining protein MinC
MAMNRDLLSGRTPRTLRGTSRGEAGGASDVDISRIGNAMELKGSVFTLSVLRLLNPQVQKIEQELKDRIAQGPKFFEHAPMILELDLVKDHAADFDLADLIARMRALKLVPLGVRNGTPEQQQTALDLGLAVMRGGSLQDVAPISKNAAAVEKPAPAEKPAAPAKSKSKTPDIQERSITLEIAPAEELSHDPAVSAAPNRVIREPVRSGQKIYAANCDLILLGAVNSGAEVMADGNIHAYGPLRGRALAGVKGNRDARIFCQSLEAELVAVAGYYQIYETAVPEKFYRRAVQVMLQGEQLVVKPMLDEHEGDMV